LKHKKPLDLALQGGGAHGAFTWGVLDRLLEDDRLELDGISGTSAGAMNAVVLADGYAHGGGREGARAALRRFWQAVSEAARFSPLQGTLLDRMTGRWSLDYAPGYRFFQLAGGLVSPYEFNPLNLNPLRDLLARLVDFDRVRACAGLKLYLSATNVRTGRARIFRREELSADHVMASACLPQLFQAVEIGGEAYWDGGYMGNPPLFPLIDETAARDLMIVQINPVERRDLPRTAGEIMDRLNEITFNASMLRELGAIALIKNLVDEEHVTRAQYNDMRLHRISGDAHLPQLGVSSKFNTDWAFFEHLHEAGRAVADAWLEENYAAIGVRSTLDIADEIACGQDREVDIAAAALKLAGKPGGPGTPPRGN
jgi:NTE family protein